MRLIDADALYERLKADEELARDRVIDTPNSFPNGMLNPAAVRYQAQLTERTRLKEIVYDAPTIEERKWIPCSEPPENDKNVFIAHGKKNFMSCCIGHYDRENGIWYEDRNWFARPIYDGMYWCEMPMLPETEG